jgi:NADH-quinone oxidoreductase subunit J
MELTFFIFFALLSVAGALSLILQRNIVYSALSLIVVIGGMGGLFVLLSASFLAVLQIVIYAGAIMALFLFVIMMVDVRDEIGSIWVFRSKLVLIILFLIAAAAIWGVSNSAGNFAALSKPFDLHTLSENLFTLYLFPFEAISVLIISSVIGALYLARKEN